MKPGRKPGFAKAYPEQVSFRAGDLLPELEDRTRRGETSEHCIAKRDLGRYYDLIAATPVEISESELAFMVEVVRTDRATMMWAEVADAPVKMQQAHGIDATDLALKIRKMPLIETVALLDLVERRRIEGRR